MNCDRVQELFADYLSKTLDRGAMRELESHCESCDSCRAELAAMEVLWTKLGDMPDEEPSADSRARFDAMLSAYSHGLGQAPKKISFTERADNALRHIIPSRPIFQAAAAILILALGVYSGGRMENGRQAEDEVLRLRTEMGEMRQLLTVSLMSQSSALDRLQGVTMSNQLAGTDDDIAVALIKRLNNDPNVNVRLAAVDALQNYRDVDWVRTELVSALERRQPPFVQISLIETLSGMKEKKAVDVFESLIEDEDTMDVVKKRARIGLENMI